MSDPFIKTLIKEDVYLNVAKVTQNKSLNCNCKTKKIYFFKALLDHNTPQ